MNIVLLFDQGMAGVGGKSNPMAPLGLAKGPIGSALMLQKPLDSIGANVVATLYCGTGTYLQNPDLVPRKLAAMCKKIQPDFVLCGPCFNFPEYAEMAAKTAAHLTEHTDIPACAMMSKENEATIAAYRSRIDILKMPKKGGTGLVESLQVLSEYIRIRLQAPEDLDAFRKIQCY